MRSPISKNKRQLFPNQTEMASLKCARCVSSDPVVGFEIWPWRCLPSPIRQINFPQYYRLFQQFISLYSLSLLILHSSAHQPLSSTPTASANPAIHSLNLSSKQNGNTSLIASSENCDDEELSTAVQRCSLNHKLGCSSRTNKHFQGSREHQIEVTVVDLNVHALRNGAHFTAHRFPKGNEVR
jgi:hypothetical protein